MTHFADIGTAIAAVQGLASGHRSRGAWTLAQMLDHAAQSVEYSMYGFPVMKPALFRATVGRAAFKVFDTRGAMRHDLAAPIPGAPVPGTDLQAAISRLVQALRAFDAHAGPLKPHFAYGALDKAQYARAHLMHLANHWDEIVPA